MYEANFRLKHALSHLTKQEAASQFTLNPDHAGAWLWDLGLTVKIEGFSSKFRNAFNVNLATQKLNPEYNGVLSSAEGKPTAAHFIRWC